MYAVDSRNGDPITFSIYRGGRVDCKAVIEMIGWLNAYDIKVKGVIIDRGFATKDIFELFDQSGIAYVAMLKDDTKAHTDMLDRYVGKIRMRYEYMLGRYREDAPEGKATELRMESNVLYGTEEAEKCQLFNIYDYKAYVSLIYDSKNGGERQETWFKKVSNAALKIQQQLSKGKQASVPQEYKGCISIEELDGKKVAFVNAEKVQATGESKGFFCLATSKALTAAEANEIYVLRNSAEEQFSMVKSQLGYDTTGTHYTEGIKAKLTLAFISAIIRNELVKACCESRMATNRMANELNQICMHMNGRDEYFACHTENQRQILLMNACGVLPGDLDRIAEAENKRLSSAEPDPFHRYPVHKEGNGVSRKGPGRTKGSKNRIKKKAIETEKKKRGRPPGSKNKKKIEIEAKGLEMSVMRKPGRPKGSLNKPKSNIEMPRRPRGRPRKPTN